MLYISLSVTPTGFDTSSDKFFRASYFEFKKSVTSEDKGTYLFGDIGSLDIELVRI